jgi:PAS domain S-box-containing protein
MLGGLGFAITTKELAISNLFHYLVFGCLLFVILIDHKNILTSPDFLFSPKKERVESKISGKKPVIALPQPQVAPSIVHKRPRLSLPVISSLFSLIKNVKRTNGERTKKGKSETPNKPKLVISKEEKAGKIIENNADKNLSTKKEMSSELRNVPGDNLGGAHTRLEELERKVKKLSKLEEEIEKRRRNLVEKEKSFREQLVSSTRRENYRSLSTSTSNKTIYSDENNKEGEEYCKILDEISECAAIVQRGTLKQINSYFAELIGYKIEEIVDRSLLDFVVPEGLAGIKKHHLDKLRGASRSSYETVFLTKENNKVTVEISTKLTSFNGKEAEFSVFKKIKDQ